MSNVYAMKSYFKGSIIERILQSWSFHTTYIKIAASLFNKFHEYEMAKHARFSIYDYIYLSLPNLLLRIPSRPATMSSAHGGSIVFIWKTW